MQCIRSCRFFEPQTDFLAECSLEMRRHPLNVRRNDCNVLQLQVAKRRVLQRRNHRVCSNFCLSRLPVTEVQLEGVIGGEVSFLDLGEAVAYQRLECREGGLAAQ